METISKERAAAFRAALDRIRDDVQAQLGEEDRDHVVAVDRLARALEVAGRLLIHASLDPVSWTVGVASLATQKVLDTSELGHNILHAQYNFLGDPRFDSRTRTWDFAVDEAQWRHEHNGQHHVFTNVAGRDPDLTYTAFRLHDREPWTPLHAVQAIVIPASWLIFDWAIGAYVSGMLDRMHSPARRLVLGDRTGAAAWREHRAFLAKAARLAWKDWLLFPALGGLLAPKILLGNLLATALRNAFLGVVIYCGHFTAGMVVFAPEETRGETKGQAAVRQVLASGNFEAGPILSVLTGHLNYQVEHHVFPTLPAWRYPAIARRLRPLCAEYGIPYNTGSFRAQVGGVARRVLRFSRPSPSPA